MITAGLLLGQLLDAPLHALSMASDRQLRRSGLFRSGSRSPFSSVSTWLMPLLGQLHHPSSPGPAPQRTAVPRINMNETFSDFPHPVQRGPPDANFRATPFVICALVVLRLPSKSKAPVAPVPANPAPPGWPSPRSSRAPPPRQPITVRGSQFAPGCGVLPRRPDRPGWLDRCRHLKSGSRPGPHRRPQGRVSRGAASAPFTSCRRAAALTCPSCRCPFQ